ncbi:hypothetical protein [Paraburkholderia caribensis]|uniref:hypothetical protein n=1 Tax=Paraburkholderia caribensis TaxID=75105 RepID=UPI00158FE6A6|nr:hypothetical protein [Paraburkholderia caribensis]
MGMLSDFLLHRRAPSDPDKETRIRDAVARVLAMNPRLKSARRHDARLAQSLKTALSYTDDLVASLPPVRDANAEAWSLDPVMRSFFATPGDLAQAFSRSEALRALFERDAGLTDAYAVLGMALTERHILGVALEGDSIRHDVPQTTLCFSDHRVRICGSSEKALRTEIGSRLIDQLALAGFERLAANRRDLANQSRALVDKRIALLESRGAGLRDVVGEPAITAPDELARVQTEIENNSRALAKLRVPEQSLELELECVCNVFQNPADHLHMKSRHVRIDSMNVVQAPDSKAGTNIEFHFARIPGKRATIRSFVLVRFPRRELLPGGLVIDAAMQAL